MAASGKVYRSEEAEVSSVSSLSQDSIRRCRTPRFAEATSVHSPLDSASRDSPFADPSSQNISREPSQSYVAQGQPADVGFGYLKDPASSQAVEVPMTPATPLKSALKVPGTPANVLSPTFREEQILEKHQQDTDQEQARDLKTKIRIRLAKIVLRGINFGCSVVVVALLAATFVIFNATRHLAPRNDLTAWADDTKTWPQIVVLVIACLSLVFCIVIFWTLFRRGHRRAEKIAVYYTFFAVGFFVFNIVMWGVAAGVLQGSKANSDNRDIWAWACVENPRRENFKEDVNYSLVCRLQSWSLICCVIEIVIETMVIALYGVVFYRYYSKQRLRKSMAVRDRARADLYTAKLRHTDTNTSVYDGYPATPASPMPPNRYDEEATIMSHGAGVAEMREQPKAFMLQRPPVRVHQPSSQSAQSPPEGQLNGTSSNYHHPSLQSQDSQLSQQEKRHSHVEAAPGEQQYDAVPIPGAYPNAPANVSGHTQP